MHSAAFQLTLVTCIVFGSTTQALFAWPAEVYRNMVYDTLALLPPALGRVLVLRSEAIIDGARSLEGETASRLARDGIRGELSPDLILDVEARIERVVTMVDGHRPFAETARELGRLLRIAADLSDPTVVGAGRPELRRVAPELLRFIDLNRGKIPLVHDRSLSSPVAGAAVGTLLSEVAVATSASIAPLSRAFWKDGQLVPAVMFDFRSVPSMHSAAFQLTLVTCIVFGSTTQALFAWPAEVYRNMVYDTLALLPPSLGRVLVLRSEAIIDGARSLEGEMASRLARDGIRGELSPDLILDVEARIERVVSMVDGHRPFAETVRELGRLLRIAADLSDPTVVGAGRPELRRVAPELLRFIDLNRGKIPLVHDRSLSSPVAGAAVGTLLSEVAVATSASIAPLSRAFWKDGQLVPAVMFDFRSVPYAETSLSYSRGVTAASYLWLSAWAKANGDFTNYRFSPTKD